MGAWEVQSIPGGDGLSRAESTAAAVRKGLNVGGLDGREAQIHPPVCIWNFGFCR